MASGKTDSAAAWSAFLGGITPRLFLEDIYRAGECYLCDVADVLEKEVLRLCEEQQKRSQGSLRGAARGAGAVGGGGGGGGGGSGDGGSSSGSGGPTDSSLHAEVAAGADFVWQTMLQAYELVGDQFELYATRNVFLWPEGVEFSAGAGSGKLYTPAFEDATDARVSELEAQVMAERKRKRTLLFLSELLSKRVPQAEAASAVMEGVLAALQQGSTAPVGESFKAFFDQAARLAALCQRLAAASPAAARAIEAALAAPEVGEGGAGQDGGGGGGGGEGDFLDTFEKEKEQQGLK